ncbi:glyoxalase superfamily protein [Terrabacter carboxydivorans]|uniref:VOC family protein n=1 Tax=Terrabacter carboxydivorans TaxID=619730 RepID=A0ABP5YUQ4_9MICO
MDMKLELVAVPVTDVDRAKDFYVDKVGFNADHDHTVSEEVRFVQLTPPGSACSIAIGKGLTQIVPGGLDNLQMVIADADAARAELVGRGVEASEVDEQPWGRFVYFSDPDGNRWTLQQLPAWSGGADRAGGGDVAGEGDAAAGTQA